MVSFTYQETRDEDRVPQTYDRLSVSVLHPPETTTKGTSIFPNCVGRVSSVSEDIGVGRRSTVIFFLSTSSPL